MIPIELLNRLIAQAIKHHKWDRVGDLLFVRDTQEMQLLLWDTQDAIARLRSEK